MTLKLGTVLFIFVATAVQAQISTLSPDDFYIRVNAEPDLQLLDLRSDEDFATGHLKKAINYDYYEDGFETFVLQTFKPKKPIYVYCFSGIRSSEATFYLSELGFEEIIVLEKGFTNWVANSKPYVSSKAFTKPIATVTLQDLEREVQNNPMLLVDFHADWCEPCKQMRPVLLQIVRENPRVKLFQVDAEKSENLVVLLKIEEIPTLILFKNGKQYWRNVGSTTAAQLLEVIE